MSLTRGWTMPIPRAMELRGERVETLSPRTKIWPESGRYRPS